MSSLKCYHCGLTNFVSDEYCKRCKQMLHQASSALDAGDWQTPSDQTAQPYGQAYNYAPPVYSSAPQYQTPPNYYPSEQPGSYGNAYASPAQYPYAPSQNYQAAYPPPPPAGNYYPPPPPQFDAYGRAYVNPGYNAAWNAQQNSNLIWREGSKLVMNKQAYLPDRCIKCNDLASARVDLKMRWHTPILYLLIFAGWLLYAIVALIVSEKATVSVPLCAEHFTQRKNGMLIGWGIFAASVFAFLIAFPLENFGLGAFGVVMAIVGIYFAEAKRITVKPDRIDSTVVTLKKVGEPFLHNFQTRGY